MKDQTQVSDEVGAGICLAGGVADDVAATGKFTFTCLRVVPELQQLFDSTKQDLEQALANGADKLATALQKIMDACRYVVWEESPANTVTTEGRNALLTAALKGSAYTAAVYVGLISSISYTTAPAVANTMATHTGWTEAGTTNAPTFAARVAATFGTAAAGALATSASSNFTMTGAGTVKGAMICFSGATSVILATTGSLYAAGLFSADKNVVAGDVIQVTYTTTLT